LRVRFKEIWWSLLNKRVRHTSLSSSVMSSTKQLGARLARIADAWPADPFRPNMQLKSFLQSLAEHPHLSPAAVDAARALESNAAMLKVRASKQRKRRTEADGARSTRSLRARSSRRRTRCTTPAWMRASPRRRRA
jgi:hypothetical protein